MSEGPVGECAFRRKARQPLLCVAAQRETSDFHSDFQPCCRECATPRSETRLPFLFPIDDSDFEFAGDGAETARVVAQRQDNRFGRSELICNTMSMPGSERLTPLRSKLAETGSYPPRRKRAYRL